MSHKNCFCFIFFLVIGDFSSRDKIVALTRVRFLQESQTPQLQYENKTQYYLSHWSLWFDLGIKNLE